MILQDFNKGRSILTKLLMVMLAVTACTVIPESGATDTPEVLETATIEPSPTPTQGPGEVLLHVPVSLTSSAEALENLVAHLADEQGFIVKEIGVDVEESLTPETQLVIFLSELASIDDIAHSHPEIGFITVGERPSSPENIYLLSPPLKSNAKIGFLSGYVSALTTADYRVGGIALTGDGPENAALQGFLNGVVFYCGLCRPSYPPFNTYPQSQLVSSAEQAPLLASVQAMIDLGVTTIYLSPALNQPEIFEILEDTEARFIGSSSQESPSDSNWVASISADLESGIEQAWKRWLDGNAEGVIELPLAIRSVDEDLLSPGKLEHIEEVIDDLESGRIAVGVDPQTGEVR